MTGEEATVTEALADATFEIPPGGWTVEHLDALPENNRRYELTDGTLSVSPSPSGVHGAISGRLYSRLDDLAPPPYAVTQTVEVRFGRRLTRIPDLLVVRSDQPERHWFAPAEVVVAVEIESPGSHIEDRATKPALYAQFGIPNYWRIELDPIRVITYRLGTGPHYKLNPATEQLSVSEPFPVELMAAELLPRWARG